MYKDLCLPYIDAYIYKMSIICVKSYKEIVIIFAAPEKYPPEGGK